MEFENQIEEIKHRNELEDFYHEIRQEIVDTVEGEVSGEMTTEDIWEVVIREGLFQNLTEHPSVALSILVITSHGPSREYKQYFDIVEDYSGLVSIVAISALVNDIVHRKIDSGIDRIG